MGYTEIDYQTRAHSNEDQGFLIYSIFLQKIKSEYGEIVFNNWFARLKFSSLSSAVITLSAPSKFVREWIIAHYFTKICQIMDAYSDIVRRIDFIVEEDILNANQDQDSLKLGPTQEVKNSFISAVIDPKFSFENFVCAHSNKMACVAAQNIANFSSHSFGNVLFIHGNVGMGKTHLLQSILASVNTYYPGKLAGYLSAERFMHCYIVAVKNNELINFKEYLRSLDMLLVDDLQFICNKLGTQKEFANTINALIEANKRVIIASDKSPYQLDMDLRTKSRLAGGIIAEIQQSDFALRKAILKHKIEVAGLCVDETIQNFLADNVCSNIRELEGSLNRLNTYCILNEVPITLGACKEILKDYLEAHEYEVNIADIVQAIATFHRVTKTEILSKSRMAKLVFLRQMAAFLAKELTRYSLQEIGKQLGGKDHATVIYYIKQFETKVKENPKILEEVNSIKQLLHTA